MGTLREENGLYERKVMAKIAPAVELLSMGATIGTRMWVSILITDENTVTVTDQTAAYDLNDFKVVVDAVANSGSDTSVVVAKDAQGVVSVST